MTSKLALAKRWCVGLVGPVAVVAVALGLIGCGSSSANTASSSSGAAAASGPTAGSSTGTGGTGWFVTGTLKGQTFQGPVTIASVICGPISVGGSSGVQVTWGGTVHDNVTGRSEQISGDMSFPQLGSWTIPTSDPHTPTASLVLAGDYSNRYGLSSGTGGLGTGGLTATATTGTVDATYSTGSDMMGLKGSWTCG